VLAPPLPALSRDEVWILSHHASSFDVPSLSIFGHWSDLFTADAIDQWFENFHHYEVTLVSLHVSNS
jgi:hypothetical protein